MVNKTTKKIQGAKALVKSELDFFTPALDRVDRLVEYFGTVNYATSERVLGRIKEMMHDSAEPISMIVTSTGGPSGTAMSFYDTIRYVVRPPLITIGSGDVDSSGILIFLSGDKRYVTPNTTLLLHLAGRIFDGGTRFTAPEMEAMVREDRLKDYQYASIVADRSAGILTAEAVLRMMEQTTILTPHELVAFGLAHSILEEPAPVA